jgi:hypothetical protein
VHIEARAASPAAVEALLALPVDAVGIGQEGCLAKLPDRDTLRTLAERVRTAGKDVTIVLPAAWERGADAVLDAALAVAEDGPTTVTANDFGTMVSLHQAAPAHTTVAAGLALTQVRVHAADGTTPSAGSAEVDSASLNLLTGMGVRTAEVDSTADTTGLHGWRVRQVLGAVPLGWARSCPTARHHDLAPPDCVDRCDTPIMITAHQRWVLNHGQREALPVTARRSQPTMTVFGNGVYLATPADPTGAHDVVVDTRFTTAAELSDLVGALAASR